MGGHRLFSRLVAVFLFGLATAASAQYSILTGGAVGTSCSLDTVTIPNRTVFAISVPTNVNLPSGANNAMLIGGSNPANPIPLTVATTSGPVTFAINWFVNSLPTPGNPTTIGLSLYPMSGGVLTGTGLGFEASCDNLGNFSATSPVALATGAGAAYSVWYTGALSNGFCDSTTISGTVVGGQSLPPPTSPNLIVTTSINGGSPTIRTYTSNPAAGSGVEPFVFTIPSTPLPYTVGATVYPLLNGVAVGTGVSVSFTCPAGGALTMGTPQAVSLVTGGIPSLDSVSVGVLALLLAMGAWRVLPRSRLS